MPVSRTNDTVKWIERGAFALLIGFLLAAPEYGGVTGVWWLQVPILGAGFMAFLLVWFTELCGGKRGRQIWTTFLLLVGVGLWDLIIVHARLEDERTKTGQVNGAMIESGSPDGNSGKTTKPREPQPAPPPPPISRPTTIVGEWRGRVNCGWRFDDLRWTITSQAAGAWKVVEFFHTGTLGITNTEPITYRASWHANTLHLVADKNHGSYEVDLTESEDGQTLSGHYSLHGKCDQVTVHRDDF